MNTPDNSEHETPEHIYRSSVNYSIMWFRYPRQAHTRTRLIVEALKRKGIAVAQVFPIDCEETKPLKGMKRARS